MILQAARILPQVLFHFYGEIKKDYEQDFYAAVREVGNVVYHGVFSGSADAVYQELGQYDVLLLPTRWKAEGLPGILVEAKISGLPAVVSDHNFNREIVCTALTPLPSFLSMYMTQSLFSSKPVCSLSATITIRRSSLLRIIALIS